MRVCSWRDSLASDQEWYRDSETLFTLRARQGRSYHVVTRGSPSGSLEQRGQACQGSTLPLAYILTYPNYSLTKSRCVFSYELDFLRGDAILQDQF
jgi:hypothetical protein